MGTPDQSGNLSISVDRNRLLLAGPCWRKKRLLPNTQWALFRATGGGLRTRLEQLRSTEYCIFKEFDLYSKLESLEPHHRC